MEVKVGDKIPIKINGVEVITTIGEGGVQRLPCDPLIDKLFNASLLDLNLIAIAAQGGRYERVVGINGKFTRKDWFELYRDRLGMSVCGLMDVFSGLKIENPLWEKESK
jgi:hypothetical protein